MNAGRERFLVVALSIAAAFPFEPARADAGLLGGAAPASIATLAAIRGGFDTPAGLHIAFGIERAVYLDGNLVTTTSLHVAETGQMATGSSGATSASIQSGSNNTFGVTTTSPASVATVIQNSLDNQKIQGVTLITATVNSLASTKSSGIQNSIQDALTGSLRH